MNTFVKFVQDHYPSEDTTQCPCNLCKNQRIPIPYEEVKIDLYKNGFNPSYKIWYLHGESEPREQIDCMQGFQNEHEDIFMDDFDEVLLNSMAQDSGGNPDAFAQDKPNPIPQGEEKLNEDAQMKFDNCHIIWKHYTLDARNWILKNHPQYLMWERRHKKILESRKIYAGKKSGYYKVPPEEEFIPWLKQQVFYSKDPKDPEWHVVLEVPSKVYFEDRTCLLRSESVVTDVDEGPGSSELVMDDELIFNEDDNIEVVVDKRKKRKRAN
ncbi:hypothetical protein FRX31_005294 [Thalictrum thalictroides]|uniref:Transposase-associated domain-containing protein n=1 Tax=Thalictrum thalictroides TaxID=46969 RepID=A0A7J6X619_THATH|nr:hypothetical protein FRX31_005294 [Thalictrum thalictroides]